MQLLAPDILEDARGFSVAVSGTAFLIGALLWLFGWRGHRFWIVLAATVGAGILGLYSGPAHKMQPLVAGLLLAVAAGALALSLIRVVAFVAGGICAWAVVHAVSPAWNEPVICLLVGGLLGLVLFRVWTMILTSSAGTLLMAYSGLCLAHKLGNVDVVALAEKQAILLNVGCGVLAFLGVVAQFLLGRPRRREQGNREKRGKGRWPQDDEDMTLWNRFQRVYRKAG
jgi:MFS family permease